MRPLILPFLFVSTVGAGPTRGPELPAIATPVVPQETQEVPAQEPPSYSSYPVKPSTPGQPGSNDGHPPLPPLRECAWEWPDGSISGWYAGFGAGLAYTRSVEGRVEDRLDDFGYNNADLDFARSAMAGKLFIGYRFERPLSVEAGWLDLGRVDGDFTIPPPPPGIGGSFRQDSSGFFASAAWHLHETELWSFSAKVGALAWESDTKISLVGLPASQRNSSEDGVNPFFGFTAMRSVNRRVGARFEVERYYLDSDPTDLLSAGLFVKF